MGQTVKVKVLAVAPDGKINLSIKKADAPPPRPERPERSAPPRPYTPRAAATPQSEMSFEDKLKAFMASSDSKISDSRLYADRRQGRRRK